MGHAAAHTEYAIVDIETTGGHASGSGITEIAILIHDGQAVIEQFESLINPECPIPLSIQAMTGITNEMVADSPAFSQLAARIHGLLAGRIFVAHHVNFDYSFLRHHLELAGYRLTVPKLCTVRMSRKIRPGLPSYSLGRLCDTLGIPINGRHRAGGDAQATAVLFGLLLEWDNGGVIPEMLKKTSKHQQLPPNLPKESVDGLPHDPGVYYFRDRGGKVIYVGKARDIRNRVAQHFSGHNPNLQRQHFLRHIYSITYERCGTELLALLLEAIEIKRLWPIYNRALKRFEPKFALYTYEDQSGFLRLAIGKHGKYHQHIHLFHRQLDALNLLRRLIREFDLHPGFCSFGIRSAVFDPSELNIFQVAGTALDLSQTDYNQRVQSAISQLTQHLPTFAILDDGREKGEQSCIWVEHGHFYGMGYIGSHLPSSYTPAELKASLTRYDSNHYMMQLIYNYAEKYPDKLWKPGQHTTCRK
ncbi:exonuclease domain-containing protein [Parapedobacter koreensis]|uniref:DNA polymerase-3 subunit epsilon n=1 Tax=Parapedobacter koreensis TaxID=332977 RepID=A0A1H7LCJ2_9SPHI|nr:exonuclease domain-containing protein [Parapedobacter koreensis]SEK96662.1 DNA polymerase-3 subunit epsilon [Parapedobacter koreensis]